MPALRVVAYAVDMTHRPIERSLPRPWRNSLQKTILMMLLALASGGAEAEWVVVGSNEKYTAYADPDTIRRSTDNVKMWDLLDFKTVGKLSSGGEFMSMKTQVEYDCKEERWRTHYLSWHSKNMGAGEIVNYIADLGKWQPVPPGSVTESIAKFACGKK